MADAIGPIAPTPPGAPNRALMNRAPPVQVGRRPLSVRSPRTFALERAMRASNLDVWYCNLGGQGSGSVTPFVS